MNARRSRPMFPRFAHLTSRLFDQSTRFLPSVFRFPGWIAVGIRYRKSPRGGSLEQVNADSRMRIGVSFLS
jgi:hypothetical protein